MINKKDLELTLLSIDDMAFLEGIIKGNGGILADNTELVRLLGGNKNSYFTNTHINKIITLSIINIIFFKFLF